MIQLNIIQLYKYSKQFGLCNLAVKLTGVCPREFFLWRLKPSSFITFKHSGRSRYTAKCAGVNCSLVSPSMSLGQDLMMLRKTSGLLKRTASWAELNFELLQPMSDFFLKIYISLEMSIGLKFIFF